VAQVGGVDLVQREPHNTQQLTVGGDGSVHLDTHLPIGEIRTHQRPIAPTANDHAGFPTRLAFAEVMNPHDELGQQAVGHNRVAVFEAEALFTGELRQIRRLLIGQEFRH